MRNRTQTVMCKVTHTHEINLPIVEFAFINSPTVCKTLANIDYIPHHAGSHAFLLTVR